MPHHLLDKPKSFSIGGAGDASNILSALTISRAMAFVMTIIE